MSRIRVPIVAIAGGAVVPNASMQVRNRVTAAVVPVYAAETGATTLTVAQQVSDAFGRFPGWTDAPLKLEATVTPPGGSGLAPWIEAWDAAPAGAGDVAPPWINPATITPDPAVWAALAGPTFTGDPKAPTPADADADTSIATTLFGHRSTLIDALTLLAGGAGAAADRLAKGAIGNVTATVYTVPAGFRAIVTGIRVINTGTNGTLQACIGGSAVADRVTLRATLDNNVRGDLIALATSGGSTDDRAPKPIILNAGDTLVLTSAAGTGTPAWTYNILGTLIPDTALIRPGRLAKGTVAGTVTTAYTVPAGKRAFITWVAASNLGTADYLALFVNGATVADRIGVTNTQQNNNTTDDPANGAMSNVVRAIPLNAGDTFRVGSISGQSFAYTVFGIELPA